MFEVREITRQEYADAREIWNVCFPEDAGGYADYYFAKRTRPENILAAFEGGKMLGCLHIIPETAFLGGAPRQTGFIAGVGTLPEHRKRGVTRALLARSFDVLTAQGASCAMLQPVDTAYYTGSGFVPYCMRQLYLAFSPDAFLPYARPLLVEPTAERLFEIYTAFADQREGMRVRTLADMALLMEEWALTGAKILASQRGYVVYSEANGVQRTFELAGKAMPLLMRLAEEGTVEFPLPPGEEPGGCTPVGERVFTMLRPLPGCPRVTSGWSLEYC